MISYDARQQLLGGIKQLQHFVEAIDAPKPTNCLNCKFFDEKKELCMTYSIRPPARTIVEGCPEWDLDIPF